MKTVENSTVFCVLKYKFYSAFINLMLFEVLNLHIVPVFCCAIVSRSAASEALEYSVEI